MKLNRLLSAAALLWLIRAYKHHRQEKSMQTVDFVDLERYMGKWYEIARLPMLHQKQCIANVTAHYALNEDGSIAVTNRCQTANGDWSVSYGLAKATSADNSKLKVTFLPRWLRWLPVGDAPYWVMALDDEYQTAMIGQPSRKYLWILSRTPTMDKKQLKQYLQHAKKQGYTLDHLIFSPHD